MPEASMHENGLLSRRKYKVRFTRQPTTVETITVAHPMNEPSHYHLWLGIPTADAPHALSPLTLRERIHGLSSVNEGELRGANRPANYSSQRSFVIPSLSAALDTSSLCCGNSNFPPHSVRTTA